MYIFSLVSLKVLPNFYKFLCTTCAVLVTKPPSLTYFLYLF